MTFTNMPEKHVSSLEHFTTCFMYRSFLNSYIKINVVLDHGEKSLFTALSIKTAGWAMLFSAIPLQRTIIAKTD